MIVGLQTNFCIDATVKSEFVEPQKLIKHTIFTRKNDVNDA